MVSNMFPHRFVSRVRPLRTALTACRYDPDFSQVLRRRPPSNVVWPNSAVNSNVLFVQLRAVCHSLACVWMVDWGPVDCLGCLRCGILAVAMRRTQDDRWMHATCAYWHPEIKFLQMNPLLAARSHTWAHKDRFNLTCVLLRCCESSWACSRS